MRVSLALCVALLAAPACRSPFAPPEDTSPDASRVGRGVHGWPLFEHAPHGTGWRTDIVWPAYSQVRTDGDGLNQTDVLWPLFHVASEGKRSRTGLFRPLFDLETVDAADGVEGTWDLDVAWPLIKWKDSPDETERRVFPLFYSKDSGDRSEWNTLLLWWGEDAPRYRSRALFPFWWSTERGDDESHEFVLPLYGAERDGTWSRTWVLPPLFSASEDPAGDEAYWNALGLFGGGHDGTDSTFYALPLVWMDESEDAHHHMVTPLWWDFGSERDSFRMLLPLYGHYEETDGDEVTALGGPLWISGTDDGEEFTWLAAPLIRWGSEQDGAWSAHAFPVLWLDREADGDGATHVWPLFGYEWHGDRREFGVAEPFLQSKWDDDSWSVELPWPFVKFAGWEDGGSSRIWPVWENETRGEHNEGDVLWLLSTWESDGDADSDFRILGRLVEDTQKNGKSTFVVNPLFRHESNDAGDTYWSFLFGLVARKQEAGETSWRFLWIL